MIPTVSRISRERIGRHSRLWGKLSWSLSAITSGLAAFCCASVSWADPINVTTYHSDGQRTGWNAQESILTPSALKASTLKQIASVALDGQVDAQPLFVGAQTITGKGQHNVVYTVTENDSVYAIDADSGTILLQRNFGAPVAINQLPGACDNNSNIVGITATPVIDVAAQALYVLSYTYENNVAIYRLHALDLKTLADKITPTVVSGSGTLSPTPSTYAFNPSAARSRPALLLSKGIVYAAFTSFCDFNANIARGWVLGWNATTLAPMPQSALLNRESKTDNNYFLSTVWMSGYGISVDTAGSLFVVTGNSDPAGTAYNPPFGIAESVVKLSPNLATVQSLFTPAGGNGSDYATLERTDGDFSSGGVMILPDQPGAYPHMAVAAGKFGAMYLMNSDDLGGYNQGQPPYPDRVLNAYTIGSCYCGESYYKGADGIGRVVSSGANTAVVWKVNTTGNPSLTQESISAPIVNGTNNGFFTTISSNGTTAGSQVIWALGRPIDTSPATINLYAFDPSKIDGSGKMATLFSGGAGSWPMHGRANLVPTVVNGKVYVGTYKQLTIFGLPTTTTTTDVVSVTAYGTPAASVYPLINVIADGKTIGSTSVGPATATYSFNTSLAPNTAHDIQIQYTNDDVINNQDRNLLLSSIAIDGRAVAATSSYEVYHAVAGPGDLPSNGNMYWTGTAEFSLPASLFPAMSPAAKAAKVAAVTKTSKASFVQGDADPVLPGHTVYGTLVSMRSGWLTLRTRSGLLKVDNTQAVKSHKSAITTIGDALLVRGEYGKAGVMIARSIQRTQPSRALWGRDY